MYDDDEDEDLEFWIRYDTQFAQYEMPVDEWVATFFPETVSSEVYVGSNESIFDEHESWVECYQLSTHPEVQYAFLRACQDVDNSRWCYYDPKVIQEKHFWTPALKREMAEARERRIKMERYYR